VKASLKNTLDYKQKPKFGKKNKLLYGLVHLAALDLKNKRDKIIIVARKLIF